MDIEDVIEKKKNELLMAAEKKALEDKIAASKVNKYVVACKAGNYDILGFIIKFENIKNIEEVIPKKYYHFELEKREDFELIEKVFEEYFDEKSQLTKMGRSAKENSIYIDNPYIDNFNPYFSKERVLENYAENYDELCILEQDQNLAIAKSETEVNKLKSKYVLAMKAIFSNLSDEQAENFINAVVEQVNKFSDKNKQLGSNSTINSYAIIPIAVNVDVSERINVLKKFDAFLGKINKESNFADNKIGDLFSVITKEAKKVSEVKKLTSHKSKSWREAYLEGNESEMSRLSSDLRRVIEEIKIPSASTIIGTKPFEFFNYYNINEREQNIERPFVMEVANTFLALNIAKYRNKVYSFLDMVINKNPEITEIKDFVNNFKMDKLTIESFNDHKNAISCTVKRINKNKM